MNRTVRLAIAGLLLAACGDERAMAPAPAPSALLFDPDAVPSVLVGAGDIADCNQLGDEATAALLDSIPGIVITVGDNAYPDGTSEEYANCYDPTWGRHKARTRPTPGNHEYNTPGAAGYFGYFGAAAGAAGEGWYSYRAGTWLVLALNSSADMSSTSPQLAWLRQELAASDAVCTMAYWHYPRFSSSTEVSTRTKDKTSAAFEALYDAGADLVITAHAHHYERFAPQKPNGTADPLFGIRQLVVGTGGESYYPFGTPAPNSEVRNNNTVGVIKLTLDSTSYTWQFIPAPGLGSFTDAGSGDCHGVPPNAPPLAVPGGPYATSNATIRFDGTASSDPDGDLPLTYRWDFGDGNVNSGPSARPTHTYTADGLYTVKLTVTDRRGLSSVEAATTVSVSGATAPTVVLSGAGNVTRCSNPNGEATAQLLDGLPGFVFTAGDNAFPNGTAADYANCYHPRWGRHLTRTIPTLGNHEYDSSATAAPAFDYFGSRLGQREQGYYSADVGSWHVIVLNDNSSYVPYSAGSAQEQWLRADLAATTRQCVLAIWHQPRFLSSNSAGFTSRSGPKILWDILYEAGADVVVNGHQHHYERMAPMNPDGSRNDDFGLRQFNVGTGGESLVLPTVAIHPNSEFRGIAHGVLKLTLRTGGYDWEFLPAPGYTLTDRGSGECHGPPFNRAPTASPGGPYASSDGTVRFDGTGSSDPDGDALTYSWDFGDGSVNVGPARPTHYYPADGTYTVTLTVTDANGAASPPASTTASVSRSSAVVVMSGAGNISKCTNNNDEATAALLDAAPGLVFTTGDNAYPSGTAAAYADCYHPTWGRHLTRSFAALGNNDYGTGNADAAFGYFGDRLPSPLGYYSFDAGDWHVVVINDNGSYVPYGSGSAQEQWLVEDLAASSRRCTMAIWHVPLFLSSNTEGYTTNSSRRSLWNKLFEAGADVVVNGSQHHYERMAPMRPDGTRDDANGIRQFNVGTGGESLVLPTVAIHPNSEVREAVYGVLSLTLRSDGYDWQFTPVAGQSFTDSGSGSCR